MFPLKHTMETSDTPVKCNKITDESLVSVKGLKDNWQRWSNEHQQYQKQNPFTNSCLSVQRQRGEKCYGKPTEGSKTEQRGRSAHAHVDREVKELCDVIREISSEHGKPAVEFGTLFERYVTISNKVVGVLLRARKQGLVHFEGEILWQGQDDRVVITLLQ